MELAEKSDLVGNDHLASAEVATAAGKPTGLDSGVTNECLGERLSSDQLPSVIRNHDVPSEIPSALELTDLDGHSHGNMKLSCSEPEASTRSLFPEDRDQLVEDSVNFQNLPLMNHLLAEDKNSSIAEPHFSEQKSMIVQRNPEESKGNGVPSSLTHQPPLVEQPEGSQPSAVLNLVGDLQITQSSADDSLQFQPGTAEYNSAGSTHSSTLMLKHGCVSFAFPYSDFPYIDDQDIEFEDDEKDLKDMKEELNRNGANALAINAGKLTLVARETRLGVSERTYSAGGPLTLLHSFARLTTEITTRTRKPEEGAVGGVAEFHDKLLKPHDSGNFMPRGEHEHASVTSNQPQSNINARKLLLEECHAESGLEDYDCEIRNKKDQDCTDDVCAVCKDKCIESAFVPCAHFACQECIEGMRSAVASNTFSCHLCRAKVTGTIRL